MKNCTNKAAVKLTKGGVTFGGVIGTFANGASVNSNTNEGTIVTDFASTGTNHIAGVIGYAYGSVKDCTNKGAITYKDASASAYQDVAGVIARIDPDKSYIFENLVNEGNVTFTTNFVGNSYLGGIAAYANAEKNVTPNTLRNCVNRGFVLSDAPVSSTAKTGATRMGGIVGGTVVLDGCTNYGTVEARNGGAGASEFSIGGISGMLANSMKDCHNFGNVLNNTTVKNILAHTGGLSGWATVNSTIENCSIDADITSTTIYNYDGDSGKKDDTSWENSSCAGVLVGRCKTSIVVTLKNIKIYGTMTRTINKNGVTKTFDYKTEVPADKVLLGASQNAAAKLSYSAGAITCESTKK
ncbi:MAG: hypothetical protein HUJ93_08405 [Bacteroidales bacterium]|nr:hypothetical protein [Bacteroidales bacterium]